MNAVRKSFSDLMCRCSVVFLPVTSRMVICFSGEVGFVRAFELPSCRKT